MKNTVFIRLSLIILLISGSVNSFAGHNRSGYISYACLKDSTGQYTNTYHFKVITYTDPIDVGSDRCSEYIVFTNLTLGTTSLLTCPRTNTTSNIELENLNPPLAGCNSGYALNEGLMLIYPYTSSCVANYYEGLKLNIYEGNYTFGDTGTYVFGMVDPTLDNNVKNIQMSGNVAFALVDTLNITNSLTYNTAPIISNNLIDSVCTGQNFNYNAGIIDIDNDSLSYKLISFITGTAWTTDFNPVAGASIPAGISIDAATGNLNWQNVPVGSSAYGEYDLDVLIKEYRRVNGKMLEVGSEVFAIQLNVICCNASGIKQVFNNKQISVYPNPSSNNISFQMDGINDYPSSTIIIQNMLGQTVKKLSFANNTDVSDLRPGCYFIQIVLSNGEIYKTKFIKQ